MTSDSWTPVGKHHHPPNLEPDIEIRGRQRFWPLRAAQTYWLTTRDYCDTTGGTRSTGRGRLTLYAISRTQCRHEIFQARKRKIKRGEDREKILGVSSLDQNNKRPGGAAAFNPTITAHYYVGRDRNREAEKGTLVLATNDLGTPVCIIADRLQSALGNELFFQVVEAEFEDSASFLGRSEKMAVKGSNIDCPDSRYHFCLQLHHVLSAKTAALRHGA